MNFEAFVTCAVTGSGATTDKSPHVPVTPAQIADSAIEAARAGAAIAHIHVRDPDTGKGSRDTALYREVVERVRASDVDVVINLTPGMGGDMVTLYDNGSHIPLLWTHLVPATLDGKASHNVQNAMFAAGICYAMGTKLDEIRHGLRTFDTTFFQAPGRMNICDDHPFRVILDYGHNPAAVEAMVALSNRLEVKGKRVLVIAAPGDRRDEDIRAIAEACAGHFDHYICRRDDGLRGRDGDEVPRMQRETLLAAGVPEASIELIPDEVQAIERALSLGEAGDLVLIFGDELERSWNQITGYQSQGSGQPEDQGSLPASERTVEIVPGFKYEGDEELIRDERGVRLAKVVEVSD